MNAEAFMMGYMDKEAEGLTDLRYIKALMAAGGLAGGIGAAVRKPTEEEGTSRFENSMLGVQKGTLTGLGAGAGGVGALHLLDALGISSNDNLGTSLAGMAAGTALGGLGAHYIGGIVNRKARERQRELQGDIPKEANIFRGAQKVRKWFNPVRDPLFDNVVYRQALHAANKAKKMGRPEEAAKIIAIARKTRRQILKDTGNTRKIFTALGVAPPVAVGAAGMLPTKN